MEVTRTHKSCVVCRKKKPIEQFGTDNTFWDKHQPKCKSCAKRLNREYYAKNQDKIRERNREALRERRARAKAAAAAAVAPVSKTSTPTPTENAPETPGLANLFDVMEK